MNNRARIGRQSRGRLSGREGFGGFLTLRSCLLLAAIALTVPGCAPPPRVPDGDKLLIGKVHYQLWGIEAPGLHQVCDDDWPAGQEARRALEAMTRDHTVVCEPRGLDRYRRVVAQCRAGGTDIAAALVGAGLAWANASQTRAYTGIEREAYVKGLGIHGKNCVPPSELTPSLSGMLVVLSAAKDLARQQGLRPNP